MTTHLSESEFVDLVEDTLDPRRAAHVESCATCREHAGTLRALLRDTAAVGVPEPSPLFWDHLSARVRDQVAAEPAVAGSGWMWTWTRGLMPLAAAAALVVAVFSGALLMRAVRDGSTPSPLVAEQGVPTVAPDGSSEVTPDAVNAEVWAVLMAAASDVAFEDAHAAGMHVHAATIDHAVQDLTAAERTELGRLLQSELKHASN
jgi:hypothetical protein